MNDAVARRPRLVVYTRAGCLLCDEFIAELTTLCTARGSGFELRDVDADAWDRRRFGARVPVLTAGDQVVCDVHLDVSRVARLLAA